MQALLAALLWGVMPIYFKLLLDVDSLEVVAHRIVWSVPLLLFILWLRKNLKGLKQAWGNRQTRLYLFLTSVLVAANWLIYVWAVQSSHILGASLGYFISPLLSVVLGMLFLKEKLSRNQWIAVGIAAVGVSVLAAEAWQTLWISLVLAGSWSMYSLIRKIADAGPVVGLTIETSLLAPLFALFLLWITFGTTPDPATTHFGDSLFIDALLLGGAIMTAAPLLLFNAAVKKLTLSATGLLLFVAPSIQFLIAVLVYQEEMTVSHFICFGLIWISLAIFSTDSFLAERRRKLAVPPA